MFKLYSLLELTGHRGLVSVTSLSHQQSGEPTAVSSISECHRDAGE